MLSATDLSMAFGGQTLFTDANLRLDPGKRYGIVGANGSGKSTLLKILSGQLEPSGGDVVIPKASRIGVLEQDHFHLDETRILDVVMMGNKVLWEAMVEKEEVLARAEDHFDADRYTELEDIVLRFDGYTLDSRAGKILEGLGIPTEKHTEPLGTLSGGFKLRVLLAQVLASEPDLLFLDEPTNHLDILAIAWLEQFLIDFRGVVAVVSHDMRFLDAVCTDILDVDYQQVTAYKGNYTAFTRQHGEQRERMEAEIAKRQKEIDDHKAFIARFKAKATKARQANSRQKRLEKIEITTLPTTSRRHPRFKIAARRRSGREVLTVKHVSKAYDELQVLDDVSLSVERGDRLAIIGPNGIGKSTLLKIAVGALEADEGTASWGYECDVGYYPQDHTDLLTDPTQTLKGGLWEVCPEEGLGQVLARLGALLFDSDDGDKPIEHLSGGEAARLVFARLQAQQPTVLVLDEPTNHLDLEAIESLAKALKAYDGTLIFVSHDRWFVDRLATRIVEITPQGVTDFRGSYKDFLRFKGTDHLDREAVVARDREKKRNKKKRKRA